MACGASALRIAMIDLREKKPRSGIFRAGFSFPRKFDIYCSSKYLLHEIINQYSKTTFSKPHCKGGGLQAQNNAISLLWAENRGVQTTPFGAPSLIDATQHFYRAGTELNASKGLDTKIQKWDPEGTLLWTASLNNTTTDQFQPVQLLDYNNEIYLLGVKTDANGVNADLFLAQINQAGVVEWLTILAETGEQVPASFVINTQNEQFIVCGTTDKSGNYDMLLQAISIDGQQLWQSKYDFAGQADVGLKVFVENGLIQVNGSSQTTQTDWDIVSWFYNENGDLISEERTNGIANTTDELKDGVLQNGFINLVGRTLNGLQSDAKIVVLDATNNYLWNDTYSFAGLNDEFTAVITNNAGTLTTVGYTTIAPNNEDLLLRKYTQGGALIWHTTFDAFGENDRAIKVLEDNDGNYLVLANVTQGAQKDVYIYCFEGTSGNLLWEERISDDPTSNETALNLEANMLGDIYVTYAIQGITKTKAYNYEEVHYPLDNEPFSKGSLILEAAGRVYHANGTLANDIKYTTFGLAHEYFFADDFFSTRLWDYTNDNVANDFIQRIDFSFAGSQPTSLGHISQYTRPEFFNYYLDAQAFEQQQAQNVLAYPNVYPGTDAFITTNSQGFKLVLVLKDESANLADIALQIDGATGTFLHSGDVHIPTLKDDIVWINPFSYTLGGDTIDDNLTEYYLDANGRLRFTHQGDVQYPYVIQIKNGIGAAYTASAIDNMDWSTFFGGDGDDGSFDMTVDESNGDLFVAGFTQSWAFPNGTGVTPSMLNGQYKGLVAKFNQNAVLQWVSILGSATTNGYNSYRVKGVGLHENITTFPMNTKEVHIVGEYRGNLSPSTSSNIPSGAYQQSNTSVQTTSELFIGTLDNSSGTKLLLTPFGGAGHETVNALDITPGGILYFVGSTTQANNGSNVASSSQNPPANHTLPVYNPNDGSFFTLTHPNIGNKRGYVAAIDLSSYKVVYASIILGGGISITIPGTQNTYLSTDFDELYDICFAGDGASYCGRGVTHAKIGTFNPASQRFAGSLSSFDKDWKYLEFFSSTAWAHEYGWVYFGLDDSGLETPFNFTTSQYQSTNGEAFLLRIDEGFVKWKTYFGLNGQQADMWNGYAATPIDFWSDGGTNNGHGLLPGRGRLSYNNQVNTLFASASVIDNAPSYYRPGYFYENVNANTWPAREDIYLAAFSYKNHANPIFDFYNWGTMYGNNSTSQTLGGHLGREFLGDVHSYSLNNQAYVLTTATSRSESPGSYISNPEKYPVSSLSTPNSWFKDKPFWSFIASDIVITRFGITNIETGLDVEESTKVAGSLLTYPNPCTGQIKIQLANQEAIAVVSIVDINGRLVYTQTYANSMVEIELNLGNLAPGIYFINANYTYHAKISKL